MKKRIKELDNYLLNNPFIQKKPFKEKFMLCAFLTYKKVRIFLSKWIPLNEIQKRFWNYNLYYSNKKDTNSPSTILNDSEKIVFKLKYITIIELIPKEQIKNVVKGIRKFEKKQGKRTSLGNEPKVDFFKFFSSGDAYSELGTFYINDKSPLRDFIECISFKAINLTNSFLTLGIQLTLNEKLSNLIETYAIGNVETQHEMTGYNRKKWYQFTKLNNSYLPGEVCKNNIINSVIDDIKWNISKELYSFIPFMIFQSQKIQQPCICSIYTNIKENSNNLFWKSVDVDLYSSYFKKDRSVFLSMREDEKNPFCVYLLSNEKNKHDEDSPLLAYFNEGVLYFDLIFSIINKTLRKKLSEYCRKIALFRKKNINHWLSLKVDMDSSLFYFIRSIDEYILKFDEAPDENSFFENNFEGLKLGTNNNFAKNQLYELKKLYESIVNLFQSNIDYKNTKEINKMQKFVLSVSVISVIISFVAVIIANPTLINILEDFINWIIICIKNIF